MRRFGDLGESPDHDTEDAPGREKAIFISPRASTFVVTFFCSVRRGVSTLNPFHQSDYFCGVESALGTLLAVLSPAVFGWFLQLGIDEGRLGVVERYRLLALVTAAVQGLGAWYIVRAGFDDYVPSGFFVRGASSLWNRARTFTAVKGVAEGSAMFIPTLIILRLVGQEGAVGVTQSLS
jgi:hypothetical protein